MNDVAAPGAPPLVLVAHGSRDPRSRDEMSRLAGAVSAIVPGVDVRLSFLGLNSPSVDETLDDLAAQGHRSIVVTPILLGDAFHAKVDLPGIVDTFTTRSPRVATTLTPVLGSGPSLLAAVRSRIVETGVSVDTRVGLLVPAVGSSDSAANARTRRLAPRLAAGTSWSAVTCFATSVDPGVDAATDSLLAQGLDTIVVAPWFLAPGLLLDRALSRVRDLCGPAVTVRVAAPLGAHPLVASVVADRYTHACAEFRVAA